MARIDYKMMYQALVERIKEQEAYHAEREYHFASEYVWDTGRFQHQSKKEECEDLLCFVAGMENAWAEHLDANDMVSLHLYKIYEPETCILDLSCQKGQEPKAVFHELMTTVSGYSDMGVTDNVLDHMANVRYNGFYGVPLDAVICWTSHYVWRNDAGKVVEGPEVYLCRYWDTALNAKPVA